MWLCFLLLSHVIAIPSTCRLICLILSVCFENECYDNDHTYAYAFCKADPAVRNRTKSRCYDETSTSSQNTLDHTFSAATKPCSDISWPSQTENIVQSIQIRFFKLIGTLRISLPSLSLWLRMRIWRIWGTLTSRIMIMLTGCSIVSHWLLSGVQKICRILRSSWSVSISSNMTPQWHIILILRLSLCLLHHSDDPALQYFIHLLD